MAEILPIQQKTPINQSIEVKTGYSVEKYIHTLYSIPGPPFNVVNMFSRRSTRMFLFLIRYLKHWLSSIQTSKLLVTV